MSFIYRQSTLEKLNFLPFRSKFNPSRRLDLITSSVGVAREMSRKQNKCKERIQFIFVIFHTSLVMMFFLFRYKSTVAKQVALQPIKIYEVQKYSSFCFVKC